jgi:glutamate transport system substrate-binding protein
MPLGKPNLQWPAKIATSAALCLAGAAVGTGLYFANLAYVSARTPTSVFANGTITVALNPDRPGMSYVRGSAWSGFEYDLATYIASSLNVRMKVVPASPSQREDLLRSGQVDLVVSTLSQTPERAREVSMAGPYLDTGQGVLVKVGETSIKKTADLKGKTMCDVVGSASLDIIRETGYHILPVEEPNFGACVQALLQDRVDAISNDQVILYGYAQQNPQRLRVLPNAVIGTDRYVVGLPLGHHDDCVKVATAIRTFLLSLKWAESFASNLSDAMRAVPSWETHFAPSPDKVKCQT